jgi:predicted RNA binding protein YcfA (HicA-like mRNA interferase family)
MPSASTFQLSGRSPKQKIQEKWKSAFKMPWIPGVPHLQAIRALEKVGFKVLREGKHTILSDGSRILTIPRHNPINAFTMGGIAKDAGLSVEEFRKLI